MSAHGFKVGQRVFVSFYASGFDDPDPDTYRYETIEKVGRRWATLTCGRRFDLHTRLTESVSHPSRVFHSEEECRETIARDEAWVQFLRTVKRVGITSRAPEHLTASDLSQMITKLYG